MTRISIPSACDSSHDSLECVSVFQLRHLPDSTYSIAAVRIVCITTSPKDLLMIPFSRKRSYQRTGSCTPSVSQCLGRCWTCKGRGILNQQLSRCLFHGGRGSSYLPGQLLQQSKPLLLMSRLEIFRAPRAQVSAVALQKESVTEGSVPPRRLPRTFNESMGHVAQERREARGNEDREKEQRFFSGTNWFLVPLLSRILISPRACENHWRTQPQ